LRKEEEESLGRETLRVTVCEGEKNDKGEDREESQGEGSREGKGLRKGNNKNTEQ
jgi:hypothetical protein